MSRYGISARTGGGVEGARARISSSPSKRNVSKKRILPPIYPPLSNTPQRPNTVHSARSIQP
eukprot:12881804-Prorocentrum_lima.AAC.1